MRRRRLVTAAIALIAAGSLTATSFASGHSGAQRTRAETTTTVPARTSATIARHTGVGIRDVRLVDEHRSTYDYATGASHPGRILETEIRYPSTRAGQHVRAPAKRRRAPYPVVVFAEGYRARPDLYRALLDAWVRAGYVVASPEFPDTTYPATEPAIDAGYPHGSPENDIVNEPADIAFVLRQLAKASAHGFWRGLLDTRRVLLAGQSDGGALVAAYAYDARYGEPRANVRAVAAFAGYELPGDTSAYREPVPPIPALVVQSTTDTCNEPELSVDLYDALSTDKYFMRIEGATHLGPFDGANRLAFIAVRRTTIAFFRHALAARRVRAASVVRAGTFRSITTVTRTSSVPPIPDPAGFPYCAPAY